MRITIPVTAFEINLKRLLNDLNHNNQNNYTSREQICKDFEKLPIIAKKIILSQIAGIVKLTPSLISQYYNNVYRKCLFISKLERHHKEEITSIVVRLLSQRLSKMSIIVSVLAIMEPKGLFPFLVRQYAYEVYQMLVQEGDKIIFQNDSSNREISELDE